MINTLPNRQYENLSLFLLEHVTGMTDRAEQIRDLEWSFGNGQCPVCLGKSPHQPGWGIRVDIGHAEECPFAKFLEELECI